MKVMSRLLATSLLFTLSSCKTTEMGSDTLDADHSSPQQLDFKFADQNISMFRGAGYRINIENQPKYVLVPLNIYETAKNKLDASGKPTVVDDLDQFSLAFKAYLKAGKAVQYSGTNSEFSPEVRSVVSQETIGNIILFANENRFLNYSGHAVIGSDKYNEYDYSMLNKSHEKIIKFKVSSKLLKRHIENVFFKNHISSYGSSPFENGLSSGGYFTALLQDYLVKNPDVFFEGSVNSAQIDKILNSSDLNKTYVSKHFSVDGQSGASGPINQKYYVAENTVRGLEFVYFSVVDQTLEKVTKKMYGNNSYYSDEAYEFLEHQLRKYFSTSAEGIKMLAGGSSANGPQHLPKKELKYFFKHNRFKNGTKKLAGEINDGE